MPVQINVEANQTALAQSIAQGVAQFNNRLAARNKLDLKIDAKGFSQPLGRITSDLNEFESALKASNARVLAFGASTAVLGGVAKAFYDIADATIVVEKSITDINRILNLSTGNLQKFSSELFNISKQTAVGFEDAARAATEFSRQGLGAEETLKRTKDALILVRLAGVDSAKAVQDLTAAVNGFSREGLDTTTVLNRIVAVEEAFAVSAKDLTEALSRAGQSALEAKGNFNQLNALVAAAQETTARGGAVIGNALKTIFTRLQRSETLNQLERFNIEVRDLQGNILPAVDILQNFSSAYKNLGDAQRAYLSEQVAGVYQVNILKALVNDLNNEYGVYNKAVQIGASATNEATLANEQLNKTLSALITQTGIGLQQLSNNIGKVTFQPIFEAIVSPVNDAVSYINEILEGEGFGTQFAEGLLKGVRNVIAGPGLIAVLAVVSKIVANTFKDLSKALPAVLGLTSEAQKRAAVEQSILSILQSQTDISKVLQSFGGNRKQQADLILQVAKNQTVEYQKQLALAKQLATTIGPNKLAVGAQGLGVSRRRSSGGYIPENQAQAERIGAVMGGYSPGKVVKSPIGGIMNTAEEIRYFSGFNQPFINPPQGSKAGKNHRRNSMIKTGIDPYAHFGFIPNFNIRRGFNESDVEYRARVAAQKKTAESQEKEKLKQKAAGTFDLTQFASMLVPQTRTTPSLETKNFEEGFSLRGKKYKSAKFSVHGLDKSASKNLKNKNSSIEEIIDKSLFNAGKQLLQSFNPEFIKNSSFTQQEIEKLVDQAGGKGARESLKGAFFEGVVRKLVQTKNNAERLDPLQGTLDTVITKEIKELFVGPINSKQGDFKANSDSRLRGTFAKQALKNLKAVFPKPSSKKTKSFLGFIPNFAYKNAVMSLEEKMSGEKAVFSNIPFPHVRNTSQASFQSAVSDHGGLSKAISDAYENQSNAGLVSKGFIPNFNVRGPRGGVKQVIDPSIGTQQRMTAKSEQDLLRATNNLVAARNAGVISDEKLNQATEKLFQLTNITIDSQEKLNASIKRQTKKSDRQQREAGKNVIQRQGEGRFQGFKSENLGQRVGGNLSRLDSFMQKEPKVGKFTSFTNRIQESPAAALAAPILGGIIEQAISGGRDRSEMGFGERFASRSASSVTTGFFTGAAIGGPGGAIAGTLIGLGDAAMNARTSLDDLAAAANRNVQIQQDNVDSLQAYYQTVEKLNDASSADEKASAERERRDVFKRLNASQQSQIDFSITDPVKLKPLIDSAIKQTQATQDSETAKLLTRTGGVFSQSQGDLQEIRKSIKGLLAQAQSDPELLGALEKVVEYSGGTAEDTKKLNAFLGKISNTPGRGGRGRRVVNPIVDKTLDDFKLKDETKAIFRSQGTIAKLTGQENLFSEVGFEPTANQGANVRILREELNALKQAEKDIERFNEEQRKQEANNLSAGQVRRRLQNNILGRERFLSEQATLQKGNFELDAQRRANRATNLAAVLDPVSLIEQEREVALEKIKKEAILQRDRSAAEFARQLAAAFEKTTGGTSSENLQVLEEKIRAYLDQERTTRDEPVDLNRFLSFLNRTAREEGGNFQQYDAARNLIRDFNSQSFQSVADQDFKKQKVIEESEQKILEARIKQKKLAAEEKSIREFVTTTLARDTAKTDLSLREASISNQLSDPSNFYGMSIEQEVQERLKLQESIEKERIALEVKNQLIDQSTQLVKAQAIIQEQSLRIRNEEDGLYAETADRLEKIGSELQKNIKSENISLDTLKETKKALKDSLSILSVESDQRQGILDSLQQIEIVEGSINNYIRERNGLLKQTRDQEEKNAARSISASDGFNDAIKEIRDESQQFPRTLAKDTTFAFRDGLVGAMQAAANETDNLKDALLNVALSFAQSLQQAAFTNLANQIVLGATSGAASGATPRQRGGIIKAQNGMYISGGRTGDRNLALLEDGEYVLNRQAVKGLGGPQALDSINYDAFPRFARGGRLKSGERKLSAEVGLGSIISSEGTDASGSINLSAKSDRLSGFALENEVFVKEYFAQQRQIALERERRRKEKKAKRRQMIAAFVSAAVGAAAGSALKGINFGGANPSSTTTGGAFGGGEMTQTIGGFNIGSTNFGGQSITSSLGQADIFSMGALGQTGGYFKNASFVRANSGGYIPYGNRITDSVPAMLTGGEYVVNSRAVRKYGVGGLNSINSGIARFQEGGAVSPGGGSVETQTSSSSTNNISVNITVNNQAGGKGSSETEEMTGGGNADTKTEGERMAKLSKQIKTVVMQVLNKEQRSGGLLDSTKKVQQ